MALGTLAAGTVAAVAPAAIAQAGTTLASLQGLGSSICAQ